MHVDLQFNHILFLGQIKSFSSEEERAKFQNVPHTNYLIILHLLFSLIHKCFLSTYLKPDTGPQKEISQVTWGNLPEKGR